MSIVPSGMEILGVCPECTSTTIENRPSNSICADCGYTDRPVRYYCTPETLPAIIEVTVHNE